MQQIIEKYNSGQYKESLNLAVDALNKDRKNIDALSYKASSLFHLDMFEDALVAFSECLSLDDSKFYLWVLRGDTHYALKDYERALSDYWISLQIEPDNGAVFDRTARTLFLLGDEDSAFKYIRRSIDMAESPEPMLILMTMLKKTGFHGFIHEIYNAGVKKFPAEKERFEKFLKMDLE